MRTLAAFLLLSLARPFLVAVGAPQDQAPQQARPVEADTAAAPLDSLTRATADSVRRALDSAAVAALADTVAVGDSQASVPVRLLGREVFEVFSGVGSYSPSERAERLSERLDALARDARIHPDSLRVVDGNELTTILYGELVVMSVTEKDARALGVSRHQAAVRYASEIAGAVRRVREQSTMASVLRNAVLAAVLLVVLVLLLKGLSRIYRWVDAGVERRSATFARPVALGNLELVPADRIIAAGRSLVQLLRLALSLLLVYFFLTTVFGLFPWTQSWSRLLLSYLLAPIRAFGQAIVGAAPDVLAILVIIALVRWMIKASNFFFQQVALGSVVLPGFHMEFAEPTRKIVRFLLVVLGIMLIYPYTPIAESRVFQGLTVFLGVLFSLGSSGAVSNIVAGIVLTYTRAFQVGDRIKIGETTGDVIEKTFLVTRLRTSKNEEVAIPNASVLSGQITNYSTMARSGAGVVLHTTVTIGYEVPWSVVHGLLVEAARRTADVEPDPEPFVLQTVLGDFSVAYQVNGYTRRPEQMAIIVSDLHRHIQDAFAEAGVEILSPVYEAGRDGNASTVPVRSSGNGTVSDPKSRPPAV